MGQRVAYIFVTIKVASRFITISDCAIFSYEQFCKRNGENSFSSFTPYPSEPTTNFADLAYESFFSFRHFSFQTFYESLSRFFFSPDPFVRRNTNDSISLVSNVPSDRSFCGSTRRIALVVEKNKTDCIATRLCDSGSRDFQMVVFFFFFCFS